MNIHAIKQYQSEVEKIIHFGNLSALEWVLDQYKEKKPKYPTIAAKFNTYRFSDYREKVIDLLKRVCTVSVETMKVVREMDGKSKPL